MQFKNGEMERDFLSSLPQYYDKTCDNETTTVSNTATNTKRPFAAMRAHYVLNKMEQLASSVTTNEHTKNRHILVIRPDIKSYTLVLKAWVRSREYCSLEKMQEIFSHFEELEQQQQQEQSSSSIQLLEKYSDSSPLQPTVQCYNLYLYALANSKESSSKKSFERNAEKANIILQTLRNEHHPSQKEDTIIDSNSNHDQYHNNNTMVD